MEILAGINIIDIFLHLDTTLEKVIADYQTWVYLLLFAVVFCETGFVVTPFLPGDSLLFAAGSLAALQNSVLNVGYVYAVLGVGGDTRRQHQLLDRAVCRAQDFSTGKGAALE